MMAAAAVFFFLPREYAARSTVRVLNAPFDFQTLATSRDVAQVVADQLKLSGGAESVQQAVSVDPIVPRFVYSSTYSDLLAISVSSRSKELAIQINSAIIAVASDRYQKIEGRPFPVTVIDPPYVGSAHNGPTILAYLFSAGVLGITVAFCWVWLRQRAYVITAP